MRLRRTAPLLVLCLFTLCGFKLKIKGLNLNQTSRPAPAAPPADPKPIGGLCDATNSLGICYLFSGAKNAESKVQNGNQMACKFMKGKFAADGKCPPGNRLGRCTVLGGSPEEYLLFYFAGKKLDAGKAASDCADAKSGLHRHGAGTWLAGN
jgi:hypothetical protein